MYIRFNETNPWPGGRGDSQCVVESCEMSCVSIVSTVEARDDGATVDARSMRLRVSAMCAPHHSAASPDVRKSRMRRVSPMRARTEA